MKRFTVIMMVLAGVWLGFATPVVAISAADFASWLKSGSTPSTVVIPFWQYWVNDQQKVYSHLCVGSTGPATMVFNYYNTETDQTYSKSFDISSSTGGQICNGFEVIAPTVAADGENHHGYVMVIVTPGGNNTVYVESHMAIHDADGRQVGGYHIPGAVID